MARPARPQPLGRAERTEKYVSTFKRRERRWRHFLTLALGNSSLALKPPDITNNLRDVICSHAFDLRHVPKLPMVGFDPLSRSPLKREIRMVTGLIDFMHQGGTLSRSHGLHSMAGRTKCIEFCLAVFEFFWQVFLYRSLGDGSRRRGFPGIRPILRTSNNKPTKNACHTSENCSPSMLVHVHVPLYQTRSQSDEATVPHSSGE
jgi:hypothetical protein